MPDKGASVVRSSNGSAIVPSVLNKSVLGVVCE